MGDQLVQLLERRFVEQQLDTLAGRKFAFLMLPLLASLASAQLGGRVTAADFLESVQDVNSYCNACLRGQRNATLSKRG